MKKIHIILISILCGLSSCTSVLDKEPLDIISDDVLWNDPVLIDNYLLQCYAEMCFFNEMPYGATHDRLRRRIDQRMDPDTQNPLAEHQRRRLGLVGLSDRP